LHGAYRRPDLVSYYARLLPTRHVLAYIYAGPCVHVSGLFCHVLYTVSLSTFSQSEFLIAASFAY
ncbi:hypothetical protein PENTCL1PPCAC_1232, partial [Pristionchus entomophagus]